MKKTNPYLGMDRNTLVAAALLQAMELQVKAAKVLLTGSSKPDPVVKSILQTLQNPRLGRLLNQDDVAEAFAAPPPGTKTTISTKGMDNFSEVPETTAKIVVAMSGASFHSIPQIAQDAGVSTETVRRYLYKVLLPNQMARAGIGSDSRPGYRKVIANTRKIE